METKKIKLPPVGQRIIKSAVAVFLCYLVDILRNGTPFYSALAAIQCMQPYKKSSKAMAKQRIEGTLIGAFYGLIVILIELKFINSYASREIISYALVAFVVCIVIYTTVVFHKKSASYFSCVVYLSITMIHITDSDPYLFVFNRVADTFIGIAVGMLVNAVHLPRKVDKETLYISGLDSVLIDPNNQLQDYSKVELNRMIDDGVRFSIMTMRTPASFLETAKDINIKLPVIVMNGVALYDIKENSYIKKREIPHEKAVKLHKFINDSGHNCFVNTIEESSIMIQYQNLSNEGEKEIYKKLRKSPYRNYTKKPEGSYQYEDVAYFMVMDETSRIIALFRKLVASGFLQEFEIVYYPSIDYPHFSYMKIYEKGVSKQAMLKELKKHLNVEKSCSIGSIEGEYDIVIAEKENGNKVIKHIQSLAKPVCLSKFISKK